ncbi:MAG: hypothetical protein HYU29_07095 [Chloroflexi bacterium]|nr:hypothetical protein [Chloroflexota bacterium]
MTTKPLASRQYTIEDPYEAIEFCHRMGWTDGLPVIPPTEERVRQFLDYAGRSPSDVIGVEPTKGKVITVEKVAINAVMAGCLAEYLPVVLAAVEAMARDSFNLHAISVSTAGAAVLAVVNGPIARDLGMNAAVSLFGAGPRPNACIGRALRLVIMNVTGARPGELDKATLGHPGKYSYCIAEREEASPWEPLHVERGLPRGGSAVSVFAALSPWQFSNSTASSPEVILSGIADTMKGIGPQQGEVVLVMSPEHLFHIRKTGWSKGQVKEFVFRKAQRTVHEWIETGKLDDVPAGKRADDMLGVLREPRSLTVIVAGGDAGGNSAIIGIWGGGTNSRSVTVEVRR